MKRPLIDSSEDRITVAAVAGSSAKMVSAGSVLCVMRSGILRHTFPVAMNTVDVTLNQDMRALTPRADVNARYLTYYLQFTGGTVLHTASKAGTTVNSIEASRLDRHPVPVVDADRQRAIVARIDELFAEIDDGETALARARDDLATWREALLQAAVTGELTVDWRVVHPSTETGADLLDRILVERRARWSATSTGRGKLYAEPIPPFPSDGPPLPYGWARCSADQISDFITKGTTPPKNLGQAGVADIPFVRVTNLTSNGILNFSDQVFVSKDVHEGFLARSITLPADVLMNIVGPPLGQVSVVPNDFPEWNINQAIARFRPVAGLLPEYLSLMLRSQEVQAWLAKRAKATSGQVNLTLELCRTVPLALPPVPEQAEILRRLADVLTSASMDLSPMRQVASTLRQSILAAAFRGELA